MSALPLFRHLAGYARKLAAWFGDRRVFFRIHQVARSRNIEVDRWFRRELAEQMAELPNRGAVRRALQLLAVGGAGHLDARGHERLHRSVLTLVEVGDDLQIAVAYLTTAVTPPRLHDLYGSVRSSIGHGELFGRRRRGLWLARLLKHPHTDFHLWARVASDLARLDPDQVIGAFRTTSVSLLVEAPTFRRCPAIRLLLREAHWPAILHDLLSDTDLGDVREVFGALARLSPRQALSYLEHGSPGFVRHLDRETMLPLLSADDPAIRERAIGYLPRVA